MKFTITRVRGKALKINADYYKQEPNGSLVFRMSKPDHGTYPLTVATVAAGQWVAVLTDGEC